MVAQSRLRAIAIGALMLLTPTSGLADRPGESAELAAALAAYNEATIASDTKALAAIVSDDYMLVNSDASVQGKASYLADFSMTGFDLDPYVVEQPVMRIFRGSALTGGVFRLTWTQDGRRQSRRLRVAHFWVRQGDRWRLNYTQLTRVPD